MHRSTMTCSHGDSASRNVKRSTRQRGDSSPKDDSDASSVPTGRSSTHYPTAQRALAHRSPIRVPPSNPARKRITEDEVKMAVRDHLASQGFDVAVAWDRARGIDIDARHPNGSRRVIEAKAETGTPGAQQVNYFIGMLGELLQRMDDERATYGIALPENHQYRGLVDRLPQLARERIGLDILWVTRNADGSLTVSHET